jgi:glycosyltransferase involved in cell wall biosynthesis
MIELAFDGRKYSDYGIGTYIRRLLDGFAAMPSGPDCTVFVGPDTRITSEYPQNWKIERVDYPPYGLGEFLSFGRDVRRSGRKLFHTPHYTTPLAPGLPTVVTVHDLIHLRFPEYFGVHQRAYARLMVGHACRIARVVLTDSEATRKDLVEMIRVPESKIRVIPLGVDEDFKPATPEKVEELRERRGLPDRYVVFVGNPKPHKGIDILLQAMKDKSIQDKGLVLVIAGGSESDAAAMARLAESIGVGNQLVHLRQLPMGELPIILTGARMLVMPSRWEGFGLPVLEAMACGTPVVSSNAGSLPEVAGTAATLVPPDNPAALAEAMAKVEGNEALRRRMRADGLTHCQRFRWERTVHQTLEAYQSVL